MRFPFHSQLTYSAVAILIATGVAATASPASAATRDLGTLPDGSSKAAVVIVHDPGAFSDQITFNIAKAGSGAVKSDDFHFELGDTTFYDITDMSLYLDGPGSMDMTFPDFMSGVRYAVSFIPGAYTANITGNATGVNGGAYSFGVSAPTPEPEAWLSIALGIAGAGWLARRRGRKGAATGLVPA